MGLTDEEKSSNIPFFVPNTRFLWTYGLANHLYQMAKKDTNLLHTSD